MIVLPNGVVVFVEPTSATHPRGISWLLAIKVVKLIVFRTCARDFIKNKKSPRSRAGPLMSESFRTLLNRTFFNAILILVSNLILSLGHHSPNISLSFSASATIFTGFCFLSFCRFTIFHFTEG